MSDFLPECKSINSCNAPNFVESEVGTLISGVGGRSKETFENSTKKDAFAVLMPHGTFPTPNEIVVIDTQKLQWPVTASNSKKLTKLCGQRIPVVNIYSAAATVVVVTLLVLCFVTTRSSHSLKDEEKNNIHKVKSAGIYILSNENGLSVGDVLIKSSKDWNFVENLGSKQHVIHFTVGANSNQYHQSSLKGTILEESLRISGRPSFCNSLSGHNAPEHLYFQNVSHVHLSEMEDCYHYIELILTKWYFPNVRQIKLQKMSVRKQEFVELTSFIDRHNQTLRKVEIDESYICPSPDCDAGMIDFPNHDFELIIRRRRESPNMVLP